jgi:hypothetical protein
MRFILVMLLAFMLTGCTGNRLNAETMPVVRAIPA